MKTIEEILENRHLYANVPDLKFGEAKFFLEKIKDEHDKVNILSSKRLKSFNEKDIYQAGIKIAYYSSAFYSAVAGFFDSLAILHTANREKWYRDIHFRDWLHWQLKNHSDDQYLIELEDNLNNWADGFLDSRNLFIHSFHVFVRMGKFFHLEINARLGTEVKMFEVETKSGRKEIVQYFEEIMKNLDALMNTINKHFEKEYGYKPKSKR